MVLTLLLSQALSYVLPFLTPRIYICAYHFECHYRLLSSGAYATTAIYCARTLYASITVAIDF